MCENGVHHRDISHNNIMISADPGKEGGAKGFLIDPEMAIFEGMPNYEAELQSSVVSGPLIPMILALRRFSRVLLCSWPAESS